MIAVLTVLAVVENAKFTAECDSKANLSQEVKGFGLLLLSARSTCDGDRA
ncbi:hypothetical protein [Microcoleus sp. herbarium12]